VGSQAIKDPAFSVQKTAEQAHQLRSRSKMPANMLAKVPLAGLSCAELAMTFNSAMKYTVTFSGARVGPGYKWPAEKAAPCNKHERGSLSMPIAGPNANASQFLTTHVQTDWLDGKHGVFGQVTTALDVSKQLSRATCWRK